LVVVAVVTLLALRLLRIQPLLGGVLFAVLATQVALGILNVVWVLPLINATAHNTVGALLLLCVVTVNFAPRLRTLAQA
jgi:cytochrome c oxidase assembly protein subunit 15